MRKGINRKIPMIFATVVAFFSVCTAGVSTYAWFQANANVQIQTSTSSTTITVSNNAGTTYNFYAYNGNGVSGYSNKNTFHDAATESNGDFTLITNSNRTNLTSTSDLFPGESALFAIEITGLTADSYSITLDLTAATSQTIASKTAEAKHRYAKLTSGGDQAEVNIAWAMDIKACGSNSQDYYRSNPIYSSDVFEFGHAHSAVGTTITSYIGSGINMLNASSAVPASEKYYVFYKLVFSDETATWFSEKTNDTYGTNVDYPQITGANRYFLQDASGGNSNCFAGLSFQMTTLSLDVREA